MNSYFRTVLGDIRVEAGMHCQCHEHVLIQNGVSARLNPALRMEDENKTTRELREYRQAGGRLIVDAQPVYCGRMARALTNVSGSTGVHIVSVTGFHKLCFYEEDSPIRSLDADALAALFETEIDAGMLDEYGERGAAKAGLVKCALDSCGREWGRYNALFQAAARAAGKTGAHVLVHTENDSDVCELLEYFGRNGVPASHVVLCHMDRTQPDLTVHRRALDMGAYLCYDSVHRLKYLSDEEEIGIIRAMLNAGYEKQILLSLDTTAARLRAYGAEDMGLNYILTSFIPMLRHSGVGNQAIARMTRENAGFAIGIHHES